MTVAADTPITIRSYADDDELAVLSLLTRSLGGGPAGERTQPFFAWKHLQNPFGRSFMIVAEAAGNIVGFRSLMRWRFTSQNGDVRAVRAVDTATDPTFQGRGIFTQLTTAAIERLAADTDTIFNTPNEKSLPGYLKMGWVETGIVPVAVRIRRPMRALRGRLASDEPPNAEAPTIDAPPASEVLAALDADQLRAQPVDGHLQTSVVTGFMQWRYVDAPLLDYRAVGDADLGVALFRVRPRNSAWETTIAEVLPATGRRSEAAELLRRVVRAARVDQVTAHLTPESALAAAAPGVGFLPLRSGIRLVARPFREDLSPDPRDLANWRVSLGDLEVF